MEIILFVKLETVTVGQLVAYKQVNGKFDIGANSRYEVAPVTELLNGMAKVGGCYYWPDELNAVRLNYYEHHGAHIWDEPRLQILNAACWEGEGYRIIRNEKYADGSFEKTDYEASWTFFSSGQLYHFMTTHHGQVIDWFPLNMSKEECLAGNAGVYFEVIR